MPNDSGRSGILVGSAALILVVLAALFALRVGDEPAAPPTGVPRIAVLLQTLIEEARRDGRELEATVHDQR